MLIDKYLPGFRFNEVHSIDIAASPRLVLTALRSIRADDVPLIGFLMALRSILSLRFAAARRGSGTDDPPLVYQIIGKGFLLLEEDADREIVLGIVGKFWEPSGGLCMEISSPSEFQSFNDDGWAKAAWNFLAEGNDSVTRLVTETRIQPLGPQATRRFRRYWWMIRGGSGLIRRTLLKAVKRKAEDLKQ